MRRYYKMRYALLENATLLQNVSGITKYDMYYTMRRYYKMRQHRWPIDLNSRPRTWRCHWDSVLNDKPHGNLIKITGMQERLNK